MVCIENRRISKSNNMQGIIFEGTNDRVIRHPVYKIFIRKNAQINVLIDMSEKIEN